MRVWVLSVPDDRLSSAGYQPALGPAVVIMLLTVYGHVTSTVALEGMQKHLSDSFARLNLVLVHNY